MEKNNDLLNQLAQISDLIEKSNLHPITRTVIFELKEDEFISLFNMFQSKYGRKIDKPNNTFTINIGLVEFVFNTNYA